jgi:hypothetical protein
MKLIINVVGQRTTVDSGLVKSGTSLPSGTAAGDLWLDTDDMKLYYYDGATSTELGDLQ